MSLRGRNIGLVFGGGLVLLLLGSIYWENSSRDETTKPSLRQDNPPDKTREVPDYQASKISTTVDNFLITTSIPLPNPKDGCGRLVFPQRQFGTLQSLQAGLDNAAVDLTSAEPGARVCRTLWIVIDGQEQGFYLNEIEVQGWVKAETEYGYSSRLVSSAIAEPDDWAADLWRKISTRKVVVPDVLKAYAQDDAIRYYLSLEALPAKALDDPQWKEALLAKQTADPLSEQKIAVLRKGDGTLVMVADDLSFRLRRLNVSYSIADFHASVTLARQIESIVRSAKTSAVGGNLEAARAQLLRADQLEEELSQRVTSLLHKNPRTE